ncbi:MAG: hypothetical protein JNN17_09690 [Verrucomicrobiaceae bacterium]|nr:hypothetical protein [Verrucomicrobiaceae bacterium]
MSIRISPRFKPVLVMLLLAGGVCWKLGQPAAAPSSTTEPEANHRKWMHPRTAEKLNRRMQRHYGEWISQVPPKRMVCGYGMYGCCFIPELADMAPFPEPFGRSGTTPSLGLKFQAILGD